MGGCRLPKTSSCVASATPTRGAGLPGVPGDYDKLDVEERWLPRGAVVLRLPLVYGTYDEQVREDLALPRVRAGRRQMRVGAGNLLWSRAHVDDVAVAVLAALDTRAADGLATTDQEDSLIEGRV